MGGPNAMNSVEDAVTGVRQVIASLTLEHTGRAWNFDGTELPGKASAALIARFRWNANISLVRTDWAVNELNNEDYRDRVLFNPSASASTCYTSLQASPRR